MLMLILCCFRIFVEPAVVTSSHNLLQTQWQSGNTGEQINT